MTGLRLLAVRLLASHSLPHGHVDEGHGSQAGVGIQAFLLGTHGLPCNARGERFFLDTNMPPCRMVGLELLCAPRVLEGLRDGRLQRHGIVFNAAIDPFAPLGRPRGGVCDVEAPPRHRVGFQFDFI